MRGWQMFVVGSVLGPMLVAACGSPPPPKDDGAPVTSAKSAEPVASAPTPVETASAASSVAPTAVTPPPAPKSVIKIESNGKEPRRALRYAWKSAKESDAQLDLKMKMSLNIAGRSLATPELPTMRSVFHMSPQKVDDRGSMTYAFEVRSFDLLKDAPASPLVASMKGELGKLVGLKGTSTVSERGVPESVELEVPANMTPQVQQLIESVRQQMSEIAVELPEEPIGKGAKWVKTAHLTLGGISMDQISTFTLTDLTGDRLQLDSAVVQIAPPQEVKQPGLPEGAKVSLQSLDTKGSNRGQYELSALVGKASGKATSKILMNIEAKGQKQPMETKTELTTSIAPLAAKK